MSSTTRTDHAAAIKAKMNDLHQRGLMPGTETVDSISDAADALAAQRDALIAYAEDLERMVAAFTNQNAALLAEVLREQNIVAHLFDPEVAE
jgi:hypothetical protein